MYFDTSRRLAPSYGFELPPVLVHALRAWLLDVGHRAALTGLLVGAWLVDPFSLAAALAVVATWYGLRRAARLMAAYTRFLAARSHPEEHERIRIQAMMIALSLTVLWGAVGLVLVFTHGAVRVAELGDVQPYRRVAGMVALLYLVAALFACCRQRAISKLGSGARQPAWLLNKRLRDLEFEPARDVTIYSGYRPFIGSGLELVTWSFAQLLVPRSEDEFDAFFFPSRQAGDPGFTTVDLVGYLKKDLVKILSTAPNLEWRLPNLTVKDHIFVEGTRAADVPERPVAADFARLMSDTTRQTRHYLACRVRSWDGEVVTTVYVHVSLQGRTLYLEFSSWALPPTRSDFHVVDRVGGTGFRAYARIMVSTLWMLPETLCSGWRSLLLVPIWLVRRVWRRNYWTKLGRRGIDVGAELSLRELGAGITDDRVASLSKTSDLNYFQFRDVIKHAKIIERRLLAVVLDFLDEKGIDTQEYKQRALTILNNGVLHMGEGDVHAGVVGPDATYNNNEQQAGGRG